MNNKGIEYQWSDQKTSIWILNLRKYREDNEFNYFYSLLTKEEYNNIQNMGFGEKQLDKIIQRGIVKEILGQRAHIPPRKIHLERTEKGKPYLKDTDISFSYSHSGDYFMTAVTKENRIGADIQVPKKLKYSYPVMILSKEERMIYEQIKGIPDRRKYFYKAWTAKEAFAKAVGDGLAGALDRIQLLDNKELMKQNHIFYNGAEYNLYADCGHNARYYFTYVVIK